MTLPTFPKYIDRERPIQYTLHIFDVSGSMEQRINALIDAFLQMCRDLENLNQTGCDVEYKLQLATFYERCRIHTEYINPGAMIGYVKEHGDEIFKTGGCTDLAKAVRDLICPAVESSKNLPANAPKARIILYSDHAATSTGAEMKKAITALRKLDPIAARNAEFLTVFVGGRKERAAALEMVAREKSIISAEGLKSAVLRSTLVKSTISRSSGSALDRKENFADEAEEALRRAMEGEASAKHLSSGKKLNAADVLKLIRPALEQST